MRGLESGIKQENVRSGLLSKLLVRRPSCGSYSVILKSQRSVRTGRPCIVADRVFLMKRWIRVFCTRAESVNESAVRNERSSLFDDSVVESRSELR